MVKHEIVCDREGCGETAELLQDRQGGGKTSLGDGYKTPDGWERIPFIGCLCPSCASELYRRTRTLQSEFIKTKKED